MMKKTVIDDKKKNALQKFFEDMKSHEKAKKLSNRVSTSFCLKKGESVRINEQNFSEVLTSLAYMTLQKNEPGAELLPTIVQSMRQPDERSRNENPKLLMKISYKKESFDIQPFRTIEKEITNELVKNKSLLHQIIFEVWYSYMFARYQPGRVVDHRQLSSQFHRDITVFGEFVANAIYHLFGEWFVYLEKKIDVYGKIVKEFVPNLITHHKQWEKIYKRVLLCFGEKPFRNLSPARIDHVIFLRPEFSGQGQEQPFKECVEVMKQIYDQFTPKRKIAKIKEFLLSVKQSVRDYQDRRISKQLQKAHVEMDIDEIVAFFSYCILMSQRGGIGEALEYLELFYGDDDNEAKYLRDLEILHSMASLRTAAQYLRKEDEALEPVQSNTFASSDSTLTGSSST